MLHRSTKVTRPELTSITATARIRDSPATGTEGARYCSSPSTGRTTAALVAGTLVYVEPPYIRESDGSVRQGSVVASGYDRTLNLSPGDLTFIRVDHQTRLQFGPTEVVIECPFTLAIGGVNHILDPERRGDLGPLLEVYPDRLDSATVDSAATLRLEFASEAAITVPQHPRYEAWQINGPGTYLVVCTPGTNGDLTIWT